MGRPASIATSVLSLMILRFARAALRRGLVKTGVVWCRVMLYSAAKCCVVSCSVVGYCAVLACDSLYLNQWKSSREHLIFLQLHENLADNKVHVFCLLLVTVSISESQRGSVHYLNSAPFPPNSKFISPYLACQKKLRMPQITWSFCILVLTNRCSFVL